MVDEAQKASVKGLKLVRQLHDDPRTNFGLILSGANMQRLLAGEEMLESRVGLLVRFPRLTGDRPIPTVTAANPLLAPLEEWALRETDRQAIGETIAETLLYAGRAQPTVVPEPRKVKRDEAGRIIVALRERPRTLVLLPAEHLAHADVRLFSTIANRAEVDVWFVSQRRPTG